MPGHGSPLPPFVQPTAAEHDVAREIVDSHPVISAYASCQWDELHDDGQVWTAAIVREAVRRAGGSVPRHVLVTMDTPVQWAARAFFRASRRYAGGIVLAFCPTFFAVGAELMRGQTRGLSFMLGPLWIGFALARYEEPTR